MTNEEAIEYIKQHCISDYPKTVKTQWDEAMTMAIEALEETKPSGTYQCFHCGQKTVIWDADFDFEDYCLDGKGVVHNCHCFNCGAEIEYRIGMDDDEEEQENE